ncbi:DUF4145 domain-containing protein [Levilactobacillus spicheri]|uniref:DUF4145 domain-containing protein n=1 Tax=Levilactobacillus spicheri TaxID=216463 RepID=A0A0F3RUA4_9LACO|nr:DUF4145 domain-containing protein [Levilactobacillus spicheri]KJW12840.1 hypothetical protein VC81_06180 [Levilactobacillus spicheri]KJW13613.1 hypothetical protein VC81_03930 [Levilactobacillus spicheri]
MASTVCPFCNHTFSIDKTTSRTISLEFGSNPSTSELNYHPNSPFAEAAPERLLVRMSKCPNCHKITVYTLGQGNQYKDVKTNIYPNSEAKQFPEYVPRAVRNDYSEAYAILHLSPKASATLARRALQGMIRDYFGISEGRLFDEINDIKDKVTPSTWSAIDAVRRIGNIGAHMEKDVNLIVNISDNEAQKLLQLIEYLVDNWYVQKHEAEILMQDIQGIDENKQSKRHKS